jgi:hypothetical protein
VPFPLIILTIVVGTYLTFTPFLQLDYAAGISTFLPYFVLIGWVCYSFIISLNAKIISDVLWVDYLLARPKIQYFGCQLHEKSSKIIERRLQRKLIITANKFMQKNVNHIGLFI